MLAEMPADVRIRLVDFHAEATSEMQLMGRYLDGRVTAVLGTHTHVPTADERILPEGTAFQCDVGMTGPYDSIIGRRIDRVMETTLTAYPTQFDVATGGQSPRCDPRRCRSGDRKSHCDRSGDDLRRPFRFSNWSHFDLVAVVYRFVFLRRVSGADSHRSANSRPLLLHVILHGPSCCWSSSGLGPTVAQSAQMVIYRETS